ncbi:CPBP family intramembrane metalloprotease [Brevundimonas sp. S30B]|uniref:CPBP family intramembrane glutamic endopeptidase n=1 Tax=unclassified Brevundimonas TaxID=2622653 RepID=UPI0010727FFB|nr:MULTISPECIES: type II CAAX endopeptidase family protein [unclassified Brevundimonas]QBX38175.1 CPBP family intramembrane metalloprotease [Brevundimonas sp. MF30-B]TFW01689.1 CPBP family intramembrane metalloprotease [Brevundimonas sp. S30B]
MTFARLARLRITQAVRASHRSPYVLDAALPRPWLSLAKMIGLSAATLLGSVVLAGVLLGLAGVLGDRVDFGLFIAAIPPGWSSLNYEITLLAAVAGPLIVMALAILAAAMVIYRRPASAFLWPGRRPSWRLLWSGFAAMVLLGLVFGQAHDLSAPSGAPPLFDADHSLEARVIYALAVAALGLIAVTAEEIAFRGVLLRITAGFTRNLWLLCLINGVLFSAIHLDPDPGAFVARALSGVVWTWAALRLGGIEFAIGAHWANNLVIDWLDRLPSLDVDIAAAYLVLEVAIAALMLVFVELTAHWRSRRNRTPAD